MSDRLHLVCCCRPRDDSDLDAVGTCPTPSWPVYCSDNFRHNSAQTQHDVATGFVFSQLLCRQAHAATDAISSIFNEVPLVQGCTDPSHFHSALVA